MGRIPLYAMLLLQRVLVCVAAWFCAVDGAITDYGVPGLAPKRFPKNAGPDGRAVRTNLNPLMGAKARRTSDDRFGGATRAPEASLVGRSESAARAPSADAQSRGQPQAVPDPVQPAGKFAPKPRRSRFAAPVRQGSPPNTPVGAARRVLSQPGFPSRPMMPGQASDPLHSRLMQSDPFSSSGTNAFGNAQPGIPGKRSRFGARNHPKIPEQHGRPAAREDTMPRQTIGAINNNDKSFIPEQTELKVPILLMYPAKALCAPRVTGHEQRLQESQHAQLQSRSSRARMRWSRWRGHRIMNLHWAKCCII